MKTIEHLKRLVKSVALSALCGVGAARAGDIVVIVSPASALTKEQVADIFLGKNTSAAPVDLPEASPVRAAFYTKATGKEAS